MQNAACEMKPKPILLRSAGPYTAAYVAEPSGSQASDIPEVSSTVVPSWPSAVIRCWLCAWTRRDELIKNNWFIMLCQRPCSSCRKMPICEALEASPALMKACKSRQALQVLLLSCLVLSVGCHAQTPHTGPWQRSLSASNDGLQVAFGQV